MSWILSGVFIVFAYLWGSLPTGYLAGRYLQGIDIREHGSGSIGTTNVLRTLGKKAAIAVLAIDLCKGTIAIGQIYLVNNWLAVNIIPLSWQAYLVTIAAGAAILGHSKSIWIGFKGGKSVATSLGVLLAMDFRVAIVAVGIFAICLAVWQIVSVASLSAAISATAATIFFEEPLPYLCFVVLAGIYVFYLHRSNIKRLLAGVEPKIGQKLQQDN